MLTIAIVTGVSAALAAAGGWAYFRSQRSRPELGEDRRVFRCPECRQKLRYSVHRAGKAAICPRCRKDTILPMKTEVLRAGALLVGQRLTRRVG